MKELESSQEVVLLRDYMSAASGADFQEKESSVVCAGIVKEAVTSVEMMLGVDCDEPEAKNLARNRMHEVIYYKTLITSDDLDEAELQYCKYACESFPNICWQTYVRCVKACGWLDIAEQIWKSDSNSARSKVIDRVLFALRDLGVIPDFVEFFYAALRARLDSLCSATGAVEKLGALDSIEQHLDFLRVSHEKTTAESIPKQSVVSTVHFLTYSCQRLHAGKVEMSSSGETALRHLVTVFQMFHSASSPGDPDVIYAIEGCAEVIKGIIAELKNPRPLTDFLDFVAAANAGQSENAEDREKHIGNYIKSITARDSMHEVAVERLLERLQCDAEPAVIDCLLLNSDVLKSHQVLALLLQSQSTEISEAAKIQQIVRKAFSGWDLSAQESFRGEWHLKYGFGEFVFAEADFSLALTEAINMLSSARGEDIEAAKALSLLCLQSPAVTLKRLFDFAVRSSQADMVAQIFGLLRTSFCFEHEGISYSIQCVTHCIASPDLSSQELTSLLNLVKALIETDVLPVGSLVSTCVAPNLRPSDNCHRFLQLLLVILESGGSTGIERAFEITPFPVRILQLCKLLHYCMTVNLAGIRWDVSRLKERLIAVLNFIADRKRVYVSTVEAHGMCWLWSKVSKLDLAIFPYVMNLFAACGLEMLCVDKVRQMPQPLLLLCCLCQKDEDSTILKECRQRLSVVRTVVVSSIVKILPRLLASEVQTLLRELVLLFAGTLPDVEFLPLVSISQVLDSLMILSKCGSRSMPDHRWNHTAQTCITSIKTFLQDHQPISSRSLVLLTTLICHAAEESNHDFRAAVSIFLMDLMAKAQTPDDHASYVLSAIKRMGDEQLTDKVVKVLASKNCRPVLA